MSVFYTLHQQESGLTVRTQQELTQMYENTLTDIELQYRKLLQNPVFSRKQTYANRNIQKTYEKYRGLKKQKIPSVRSSDITAVTDMNISNLILLIVVIFLGLRMALLERSYNMRNILRPMLKGGVQSCVAKILALAVMLVAVTLIFSMCSFCVSGCMYGVGNLGRPIQSLDGYMRSPYPVSVGTYLILFILLRYVTVLSFGVLFLACCMLLPSGIAAVLSTVFFMGGEQYLYQKIPYNSYLAFLRQFNLAARLDTKSFFQNYHTINLFGYAVPAFQISIIQIVVTFGIGILFLQIAWNKKRIAVTRQNAWRCTGRKGKTWSTVLLIHELRKLFFHQKALLIVIILLAFQCACYCKDGIEHPGYQKYYESCSELLEGEVTKEKAEYVKENYEESSENKIEDLQQQVERGEISQSYADYIQSSQQMSESESSAWKMIQKQYEYLILQKENGREVKYLSLTIWQYLFCDKKRILFDLCKMLIAITVGLSMLFPTEVSANMQIQIRASKDGERKDFWAKIASTGIYTAIICGLSGLPVYIQIQHYYGFSHLLDPVISLPWFCRLPDEITIGMAMVGMQVIFFLIAFLWMILVLAISKKQKVSR